MEGRLCFSSEVRLKHLLLVQETALSTLKGADTKYQMEVFFCIYFHQRSVVWLRVFMGCEYIPRGPVYEANGHDRQVSEVQKAIRTIMDDTGIRRAVCATSSQRRRDHWARAFGSFTRTVDAADMTGYVEPEATNPLYVAMDKARYAVRGLLNQDGGKACVLASDTVTVANGKPLHQLSRLGSLSWEQLQEAKGDLMHMLTESNNSMVWYVGFVYSSEDELLVSAGEVHACFYPMSEKIIHQEFDANLSRAQHIGPRLDFLGSDMLSRSIHGIFYRDVTDICLKEGPNLNEGMLFCPHGSGSRSWIDLSLENARGLIFGGLPIDAGGGLRRLRPFKFDN